MLAVVPTRLGVLPAGADDAVGEAGGRCLLVGSGTVDAAGAVLGATDVHCAEVGAFRPAAWALALAPLLAGDDVVILPACPDGRDLAPHLAMAMHRPLHAGAMEIRPGVVHLVRGGGHLIEELVETRPFVATLQPGLRGASGDPLGVVPRLIELHLAPAPDATTVEQLPADVATIDLAEAPRIAGGGAGLDSRQRFELLARVAGSLDAAVGATRVITDRGWLGHERQIGTTGVVVDPRLYLAFGISGAVQHTSGLGRPDHIVSVNTDPHCPMMQLADLAIVSDANEVLDELARLIAVGDV